MKKFKHFLEADVIQFGPKLQAKKSDDFHAKIKAAHASMPGYFAHQAHIEKTVSDAAAKIHIEGKNKFALPHIQKDYVSDVHSIQALSYHTPAFKGDPDHDKAAVRHVTDNHHEIMNHIDDKLHKFKQLRSVADQAPVKQFPHNTIDHYERTWNDAKRHFAKLKDNT